MQLLAGFRNYTTLCNDESSGYVSAAADVALWFQGAVCRRLGLEKKKEESRPVTAASDNGRPKTGEKPKTAGKAGKGKEPEPAAADAPPPEPEPVEDVNVVTIEGSGAYKVLIVLEELPGALDGEDQPAVPEATAAAQVDAFVVPVDSQKNKLLEAFAMNQDLLDTVRSTLRRGLLQFCLQQCGILQTQVNDTAKDEKQQATIALDEYLLPQLQYCFAVCNSVIQVPSPAPSSCGSSGDALVRSERHAAAAACRQAVAAGAGVCAACSSAAAGVQEQYEEHGGEAASLQTRAEQKN